jgi:hypothetical protein
MFINMSFSNPRSLSDQVQPKKSSQNFAPDRLGFDRSVSENLLISHINPLPFVLEVQLEIHLDLLPLTIRGSGRLPADLFLQGFPYKKEIARSEQLRDR